ncbi:phage tail protein [Vibrio furnissii]|uniref:phage tail protein n=1 Tax=Vibrio furnissii TaxID=29494 RepID=UPI002572EF7A|nr:phage tail protein [Vibrio furnissii]WJG23708.1 hypothetical protein QSU95_22140 [Vibrio furnissii]
MSLLITHAGIAAAIRAGDLGIEYKITHISIGSAGYVPNAEQTALVAEIQKKAITRGALVAQGQLHFETVWDGEEEFEGKELGYWLEDGTLFAVDSRDGEVITYKRKNTVVTEACELNLAASTIENITVEMLGSPYATEQVAGIAKIVSNGQVDSENDDNAILTVTKALRLMARRISSSTTGTRTDVAASEKVVGILNDAINNLGSASAKNVTASPVDTTSGKVLQVGDGGLLGRAIQNVDYDDNQLLTACISMTNSETNPLPIEGTVGLQMIRLNSPLRGVQLIFASANDGAPRAFFRKAKESSFSDVAFAEILHDQNEQQIAVNQEWQEVTAQRSNNVIYTNNKSKPMFISITMNNVSALAADNHQVRKNEDSDWISVGGKSSTALSCCSYIVPAGWQYRCKQSDIVLWAELC